MSKIEFDFDEYATIIASGEKDAVSKSFKYIDDNGYKLGDGGDDYVYVSSLLLTAFSNIRKAFSKDEIHEIIDSLIERKVDLNSDEEFIGREDSIKGADLLTGSICQIAGLINDEKGGLKDFHIDNFVEMIKYARFKGWKVDHKLAAGVTPYVAYDSMAVAGYEPLKKILPSLTCTIQEINKEYNFEEDDNAALHSFDELKKFVKTSKKDTIKLNFTFSYTRKELKPGYHIADDMEFINYFMHHVCWVEPFLDPNNGNLSVCFNSLVYNPNIHSEKLAQNGSLIFGGIKTDDCVIKKENISHDLYDYIGNWILPTQTHNLRMCDIDQSHFLYFLTTDLIKVVRNEPNVYVITISNALYKGIKDIHIWLGKMIKICRIMVGVNDPFTINYISATVINKHTEHFGISMFPSEIKNKYENIETFSFE